MKKTAQYVEFDVSELPVGHEPEKIVKAYGFEEQRVEPRDIKPLSFKGQVGETEGYGKFFGDLFKEGSLTLDEDAALFNLYLLAKRGLATLTKTQKEYLDHRFDRLGYGNILETLADFDNGDRTKPVKEGYRRILLINRPLLVLENGIIKEAKGGERKPKIWPPNGYVGRTCDGAYDPDGVPLETWPRREQAEQTWLDVDPDKNEEFARDAVSYAWARNEGQGKAVLYRGFFNRDYGRFDLVAGRYPDDRDHDVGRVPASR